MEIARENIELGRQLRVCIVGVEIAAIRRIMRSLRKKIEK